MKLWIFLLLLMASSAFTERQNVVFFLTDDLDSILGGMEPLTKTKAWIAEKVQGFSKKFLSFFLDSFEEPYDEWRLLCYSIGCRVCQLLCLHTSVLSKQGFHTDWAISAQYRGFQQLNCWWLLIWKLAKWTRKENICYCFQRLSYLMITLHYKTQW